MKKPPNEVFRGTVYHIHTNGPITPGKIALNIDRPIEFIQCEINRIGQCGEFLIYDDINGTYDFSPFLKVCPVESVQELIKVLWKRLGNRDYQMQYIGRTLGSKNLDSMDYDFLEQWILEFGEE